MSATVTQTGRVATVTVSTARYIHPNHTGDVTSVGDGVTTITDKAVTLGKIQDISSGKVIGRHTAGDGAPEELSIDGGLEIHGANIRRAALTGDVTASAGSNATTLTNDAVTNAKLANMATATIKGRTTAGTGDPEDLTAEQALDLIGAATPSDITTAIGAKALALGPILLVGDGQSNMVQVSTTTVTILRSDVFVWNGSTWLTSGSTSVGGMVIRAAEKLAAETDRPVYCVISGLSGAAISNWVGSGASSARYVATKALVDGALASSALTSLSKTKIDAFVWMQGEADSNSTTYVANFETLASQLAAETWWDATATRVIMPRVANGFDGNAIRSSQIQLGNTTPWRVSVSTFGAGIEVDGVHFSLAGQADIGLRIARAYQNTPRQSIEATNVRTVATNVFAGIRAGQSSTGVDTVLIGNQCGISNTGSDVVGIGRLTLQNNTQSFATAVGARAGEQNNGTNCTYLGYFAGNASTGASNTIVGATAGANNTGASSSIFGTQSGQNNIGIRLTALGISAGRFNKGANATYIGAESGPQSDANGTTLNFANITVIGYQAQASRANQVTLGGPAVTEVITPATKIIFGALPNYANDAAADADATLISGSLYRVGGGRGVFQKP
jgi:hypothetical protein